MRVTWHTGDHLAGTFREHRGVLTTQHAASSYGQPVLVEDGGDPIGPAEAQAVLLYQPPYARRWADMEDAQQAAQQAAVEAARRAGYQIA